MTPAPLPGGVPGRGEDSSGAARQIHRTFRGLIVSGQLGAGERLPAVRQAAADLGAAPGTVAKAYKMLEAEDLVTSRIGSGTRVSETAGVLPGSITRLLRELVAEAAESGAGVDDVIDVLRVVWGASAGQDGPTGHAE